MFCIREFTFDDSIEHQQLACLWMGDHLLTVELSGYINYLDKENPSQPKKVLKVGTQLHIHLSFFTKRGAYLEYCIKNVNVPLFVLGLNICTWPFLETSVRHLIS